MRRGVLVDAGSGASTPCMIVDISIGGARLEIVAAGLPKGPLSLIDRKAATAHELKIVWRRGPVAGVSFLSSTALP